MLLSVCSRREISMVQDIFVGVLCVIAVAAGVCVWWLDNGGTEEKKKTDESEEYSDEKN